MPPLRRRFILICLAFLASACGVAAVEGSDSEQTCRECHRKLNPGLIADLESSPHEDAGVTCETCHGDDHDQIFAVKGEVSPMVCAECHPKAWEEFSRSHHGRELPGTDREALWQEYSFTAASCSTVLGCHAIQKPYPDGSIGRCGSCHPTHAFSNHEARNPRVCIGCHGGKDHPQHAAWLRSAHSLKATDGEGFIADCVECHGTHDVSDAVTHGLSPETASPGKTSIPTLPVAEFRKKREVMLDRCRKCHGTRFAREALKMADDLRRRWLIMRDEAKAILAGLQRDGLIEPPHDQRLPNPLCGPAARLGGPQLFDHFRTEAETIYFQMHFIDYAALWRAAYHTDPLRVGWEENEDFKAKLNRLRQIDRDLRARAAPEESREKTRVPGRIIEKEGK
ncbi:MAG: multiheme c-type cytochrome [Planctomycetota bacterium]